MAANQGFFQLNGPNRAQHAGPSPGLGGRPVGPPAPLMHPPAPPRAGLPADLFGGPSIEVSDVSHSLKTVGDMTAELTEYAIFRFEKMPVQSQYDDEGRPLQPTWDRAIRTRVPGMSPKETARQIQHLNRTSLTVTDKKNLLSPVLQRQIDTAQENLTRHDPDLGNYHWILAQIEHQLRPITPYAIRRGDYPVRHQYKAPSRRRTRSSKSRGQRRVYERISLTAYFKRIPRPNVHIPTLYEVKKKMAFPQHNQMMHAGRATLPQNGGPPGGGDGRGGHTLPMASHHGNSGPGVKGNPANVTRPRGRVTNKSPPTVQINSDGDSDYSGYSSSDGSAGTAMTPNTSHSGSSNGYRKGRSSFHSNDRMSARNASRRRDGNRHHGNGSPKQQQQHYHRRRHHHHHSIVGRGPRMTRTPVLPASPPAPPTTASANDFDRARDDAYLAGVLDGTRAGRVAEEQALDEARASRPRTQMAGAIRSPPRPPPYPRRMDAVDTDDFSRLSLGDEDEYGTEFEDRLQRGSILDDDPFVRGLPSHRRDVCGTPGGYDRRYRSPYITDVSESEFSPLPRQARLFRY
ncbi:hypothetical protein F4779DRAFT_117394 [Xylariaceae sp. FL0662B]|nr:hypothetical protein F4779DRAFT_117394 [Xylariaceae sp. FL0662B]